MTCLCGLSERMEEWWEEHTKKVRHTYYITHKDEIYKRRSEKLQCECGRMIARRYMYSHIQTTVHFELLAAKNNLG